MYQTIMHSNRHTHSTMTGLRWIIKRNAHSSSYTPVSASRKKGLLWNRPKILKLDLTGLQKLFFGSFSCEVIWKSISVLNETEWNVVDGPHTLSRHIYHWYTVDVSVQFILARECVLEYVWVCVLVCVWVCVCGSVLLCVWRVSIHNMYF